MFEKLTSVLNKRLSAPQGPYDEQLGQRVVGKQLGQGAERLGFMRSACATVQARTPHRELAEDGADRERVMTIAPQEQGRRIRET